MKTPWNQRWCRAFEQHFRGKDASAPAWPAPKSAPARRRPIANVNRVLLVSSGKGGVGKSTVAVNLALALAQKGQRVGLLDADLFGPSVPRMMNLEPASHRPEMDAKTGWMRPVRNHGIQCLSMGLLVGPDQAVAWRGLMVMKALQQLLFQTLWDPAVDYLVVDMPPGTGDIPLSIGQWVPVHGAVLVSTPQPVALADVVKGAELFRKLDIPMLGVVENMSRFTCPCCGHETSLFGDDTELKSMATRLQLPILASIPLHASIRQSGDQGSPVVLTTAGTATDRSLQAVLQAYNTLANAILSK